MSHVRANHPNSSRADPLVILLGTVLPAYAADAHDIVERIIKLAVSRDEEVSVQDGFELYQEMVEIRRVHADALPEYVTSTPNLPGKRD